MAKSAAKRYAIGVDYGTNSVRALIVDVQDGGEVAESACSTIPAARRAFCSTAAIRIWRGRIRPTTSKGSTDRCEEPSARRQDSAGFEPENVIGIGVDTTGSTPIPVDRDGMPLAMKPALQKNLAAHAWLWKDHTSYAEAAEITERAGRSSERLS